MVSVSIKHPERRGHGRPRERRPAPDLVSRPARDRRCPYQASWRPTTRTSWPPTSTRQSVKVAGSSRAWSSCSSDFRPARRSSNATSRETSPSRSAWSGGSRQPRNASAWPCWPRVTTTACWTCSGAGAAGTGPARRRRTLEPPAPRIRCGRVRSSVPLHPRPDRQQGGRGGAHTGALAGRVDLVVLARYTQILSRDFLERLTAPP